MGVKFYGTYIDAPGGMMMGSSNPLDPRIIVETKADLNNPETYGTISGGFCKVYHGMLVYVVDTQELYIYVGSVTSPSGIQSTEVEKLSNWRKISDPITSADGLTDEFTKLKDSNYTTKKLTAAEVTALNDSNVKEAYKVVFHNGFNNTDVQVGDTIKVYKDSSLIEAYLGKDGDTINVTSGVVTKGTTGKDSFNFVYLKADGTYELVKIDFSSFLREAEFEANDFDITSGKVSLGLANKKVNGTRIYVNSTRTDTMAEAIANLETKFDATNGMFGDGLKLNVATNKYDVTLTTPLKAFLKVDNTGVGFADNPVLDCGTYT